MTAPLFDPEALDGHTLEELGDYLDAGRTPPDPSIESSPGCQLALDALERLRRLTGELPASDAATEPPADEGFVRRILDHISLEVRSGRRIPVSHPEPSADLALTEAAVRGIVRSAERDVPEAILGRCVLGGDVTEPGAPVTVSVEASVLFGARIPEVADRLRRAIAARIAEHTDLSVASIDVDVRDVHRPGKEEA